MRILAFAHSARLVSERERFIAQRTIHFWRRIPDGGLGHPVIACALARTSALLMAATVLDRQAGQASPA
jgi:hypothetical protein